MILPLFPEETTVAPEALTSVRFKTITAGCVSSKLPEITLIGIDAKVLPAGITNELTGFTNSKSVPSIAVTYVSSLVVDASST